MGMNVPLVLTHFLDRAVSLYGDKVGVISEGKSLTGEAQESPCL